MSEQARIETLLADIKAGKVPREMQVLAAKGLLPFSQDQVLPLLIAFLGGADPELKSLSGKTLSEYPVTILQAYITSGAGGPELDVLVDLFADPAVLEAVLLSKAVDNPTVARLARRANDRLQEIIVSNQERILACPEILEALKDNPSLTPNIQRRIIELKEEFFGEKKIFVPSITDEEAKDMGITPQQYMDLFESFHLENLSGDDLFSTIQVENLSKDDLFSLIQVPVEEASDDKSDLNIAQLVSQLTVPEKVQIALKGKQEARSLLINDSSKLVKEAVVKSPKVTEPEITMIAANRSMDEDILRYIGLNRKWIRKYTIIKCLSFNPKTPVGVTMGLLPRLTKRDLKELGGEKNVPDPIRTAAQRLYIVRMQNQ